MKEIELKTVMTNISCKLSCKVLVSTIISALISYYFMIVDGYTCPDGICEGLTYYNNGDWALAGCGRWAIRYVNELTCNIVIPLYVVLMYCLCIWLSVVLLSKLWKLSDGAVIILGAMMIATPTVAGQMGYPYTAVAYALACVTSVGAVYCMFRCRTIPGIIGSTLCVTLMMGLYQSYVGMIAVLVLMTIIYDMIRGEDAKTILIAFAKCVGTSILGCIISTIILNIDLSVRGLSSASRLAMFDVKEIFSAFPQRVPYVYEKYMNILKTPLMHRNLIYLAIIIVTMVALIIIGIGLIREKKWVRALFIVPMVLLIPMASNLIGILIPYNGVNSMMQYQSVMIVPFMFACVEYVRRMYVSAHEPGGEIGEKVGLNGEIEEQVDLTLQEGTTTYGVRDCAKKLVNKVMPVIALVLTAVLTWTYILAANATFQCYRLSYRHINNEMQMALQRVYQLDGYVKDATAIVMGGFPDDTILRNSMDIYQYAENINSNPVFWEVMHGATANRYRYFLDYFGVYAQDISDEEYLNVVNSDAYARMPLWPEAGSVDMIDGYAVIKFSDEPPRE